MKTFNNKAIQLSTTHLKAVTLGVALVCGPGLALAEDYNDDSYWQNTQQGIAETYGNVSERQGNTWADIKHRIQELREGLTGVHEDTYDQIDQGMSHFEVDCENRPCGAR